MVESSITQLGHSPPGSQTNSTIEMGMAWPSIDQRQAVEAAFRYYNAHVCLAKQKSTAVLVVGTSRVPLPKLIVRPVADSRNVRIVLPKFTDESRFRVKFLRQNYCTFCTYMHLLVGWSISGSMSRMRLLGSLLLLMCVKLVMSFIKSTLGQFFESVLSMKSLS